MEHKITINSKITMGKLLDLIGMGCRVESITHPNANIVLVVPDEKLSQVHQYMKDKNIKVEE